MTSHSTTEIYAQRAQNCRRVISGSRSNPTAFSFARHFPSSNYGPTYPAQGFPLWTPWLTASFTRYIWWLPTWFNHTHAKVLGSIAFRSWTCCVAIRARKRQMHTAAFHLWGFLELLCLRQVTLPWQTPPEMVMLSTTLITDAPTGWYEGVQTLTRTRAVRHCKPRDRKVEEFTQKVLGAFAAHAFRWGGQVRGLGPLAHDQGTSLDQARYRTSIHSATQPHRKNSHSDGFCASSYTDLCNWLCNRTSCQPRDCSGKRTAAMKSSPRAGGTLPFLQAAHMATACLSA